MKIGKIFNLGKDSIMKIGNRAGFEINPLDVSLAQKQLCLIKRIEKEMPEEGNFLPIVEVIKSKSPKLGVGDIVFECGPCNYDTVNKRALDIRVHHRQNPTYFYQQPIAVGDKDEILNSVKKPSFFEICKKTVLEFNEVVKHI